MRFPRLPVLTACALFGVALHAAEAIPINEVEEKVPPYTLPEVLKFANGEPVKTTEDWSRRRKELLGLFEQHVYGKIPDGLPRPTATVISTDTSALGGKAIRKLVRVPLVEGPQPVWLDLLVYLPKKRGPRPAFLGLNFDGNHTVTSEWDVPLARGWVANRPRSGVTNNVARDESRGSDVAAWPIKQLVDRGYAFATAYYGDAEADFDGGWKTGLRGAVAADGAQHQFAPGEWGAISAWSWALSRALDYLQSDSAIDGQRVALIGHSRLGKTALWTGARDERFALVIANESGEGGAALARRFFGETVLRINTSFPHWFCGRFKDYNRAVDTLPVDQHELLALVAPRPLYVGSAEDDRWADPRGEFLGAWHAGPVYSLFGKKGLPSDTMPPVNTSIGDTVGYHIRTGKHALTEQDWELYLKFADRYLRSRILPY